MEFENKKEEPKVEPTAEQILAMKMRVAADIAAAKAAELGDDDAVEKITGSISKAAGYKDQGSDNKIE